MKAINLIFLLTVLLISNLCYARLDISSLPETVKKKLVSSFPSINQSPQSKEDWDSIINFLIISEGFDYVSIDKKQNDDKKSNEAFDFILRATNTNKIVHISFVGLKVFSEDDLRTAINSSEKQTLSQDALIEDARTIEKLYFNAGYRNSKIEVETQTNEKNEVFVSFAIQENAPTLIKKILVKSSNSQFNNLTQSFLDSYLNQPYSDQLMNQMKTSSRTFFSSKHFYQVELSDPLVDYSDSQKEAYLTFSFENTFSYFIDFEGNWDINNLQLKNLLKLDEYYVHHSRVGYELLNKIKSIYLSRGFARVEVSVSEDVDPQFPHEKTLLFDISEGPVVHIKEYNFSGTLSLSQSDYKKILKDNAPETIQSDVYVKEDLDKALESLKIHRQNQGFLKSKILSVRTSYQKDKSLVNLNIQLEEGPLTILDHIILDGNSNFPTQQIISVLSLEQKKPLRLEILEKSLENLKTFYRNSGFLEMYIPNEKSDTEPLVIYNADNTEAYLRIHIEEGPKIQVGSILIEGNTITQDSVILKELEFKEGDILTPQLIEESTARLQRLGLFSSVNIRTLEEMTNISKRTIIVRITDRNPGLFEIGIGANNERSVTLRGYTGISYRNLGGKGRAISARLDGKYNIAIVKYPESKISLGYLEPYLLESRIKGRINLTRSTSVSDFDTRKATQVNQTTYTLEQDITSHVFISWDVWSLATVRDFLIDTGEEIQLLDIANTTPSITIDYRDQPFNPSNGNLTKLIFEYSHPKLGSSATIEYARSFANYSFYLQLGKPQWVLAQAFRFGYLKNLSDAGGVPYDKKGLTLGGQSTIRGFTPDEAFPNRYDFGSNNFLLTTQAQSFLTKTELRFPISKFKSLDLGGALFYDGGSVQIQNMKIEPSYRHSAGFAIRANFPVGAIGLDFGWKLNPQGSKRENPMVVNLEVGTF